MFARLGFWWGADRWNCPSVDHDAYRSAMLSNSDKMGASPEPRFTGMFNESPSVSQASRPYDPYDLYDGSFTTVSGNIRNASVLPCSCSRFLHFRTEWCGYVPYYVEALKKCISWNFGDDVSIIYLLELCDFVPLVFGEVLD